MNNADVLVVGGGPAGLCAARNAARAGASVLLVEKARQIGNPVRTSGGTVIASIRELGIPEHLWQPVRTLTFLGASTHVTKEHHEPLYAILDVAGLYQHLAKVAQQAGAHILTGSAATPILESGRVAGANIAGIGKVRCRLAIDASGNWATLARAAGIPAPARRALGLEVVADLDNWSNSEHVAFLMDSPATYGWLFPETTGLARIGVGIIRPDSGRALAPELEHVAEQFTKRLGVPCIDVRDPGLEKHAGAYPVHPRPNERMLRPGLLLAGDAGPGGSNLAGEGIRYAMYSGLLAGLVAGRVSTGQEPESYLERYPQAWRRRFGFALLLAQKVNRRISDFNVDDWDKVLRMLDPMRPETISRAIATELDAGLFASLTVDSPRVLGSFLAALAGSKV